MDAKSLAKALLTATADQDAVKASVDAYREALTDRFRRLHTEDGIRGRVDLDGLGNARWDTPDPEPVITDMPAFMHWAEDLSSVRFTVRGIDAERARIVLASADITYTEETVLRDSDRDALLKSLKATSDGTAVTDDGEAVESVTFREKDPRLVVTVDGSRKAEARQAARAAVIERLAADG